MKLTRDHWLVIFTLIVLSAITYVSKSRQTAYPPLVSISSTRDGAKALKLWVQALGIVTVEETPSEFKIPVNTSKVFMLAPEDVLGSEWDQIDQWIKDGGTLIASCGLETCYQLANHFNVGVEYLKTSAKTAAPQNTLFSLPLLKTEPTVFADYYFVPRSKDYLVYLSAQDKPILIALSSGKGKIILSAASYPFTNEGLKVTGNPELILNILNYGRRGTIWFDEWHHGIRSQQDVVGPTNWLARTPAGHSILFIVALIFIVLLMRGQAFGRPVPLPQEIRRRGPMEYITGLANLNRRAGHRAEVMRHYHQRIKRRLGRRYRLDPTLPDEEYVKLISAYNPALNAEELLNLLKALRQTKYTETELVKLAAQAAQWIND